MRKRQREIEMGRGIDVISRAEERACQPTLASLLEIWDNSTSQVEKQKAKTPSHPLQAHNRHTSGLRSLITNHIHPVYPESPATVLLNFTSVISHCLSLAGTHSDRTPLKQNGKSHKDLYC